MRNIEDNKKAPRLGIEPRFSDLKSDVLTVERSRFIQSYPTLLHSILYPLDIYLFQLKC